MWTNMVNGSMGSMMGLGMIGMAIFWILILTLIVVLITRMLGFSHGRNQQSRGKTALNILQERYAAGEINRDEFEEKKRDIGSPS